MGIVRKFINFFGGYILGHFLTFIVVALAQFLSTSVFPYKYYNIITPLIFFGVAILLAFIIAVKCWRKNKSFLFGFLLGATLYTIALCKGLG